MIRTWQACFWAAAVGYIEDPRNPNDAADPEALIVDPLGRHPGLLFVTVPEAKTVKNRVHLDLVPQHSRDATRRRPPRTRRCHSSPTTAGPTAPGGVVLADPEGNEALHRALGDRTGRRHRHRHG